MFGTFFLLLEGNTSDGVFEDTANDYAFFGLCCASLGVDIF
jgi:hypothetical protein